MSQRVIESIGNLLITSETGSVTISKLIVPSNPDHATTKLYVDDKVNAEVSTRTNADAALGLRATALETAVSNANSAISAEQGTRALAISAEQGTRALAISTEQDARIAADTALGLRATALESTLRKIYSSLDLSTLSTISLSDLLSSGQMAYIQLKCLMKNGDKSNVYSAEFLAEYKAVEGENLASLAIVNHSDTLSGVLDTNIMKIHEDTSAYNFSISVVSNVITATFSTSDSSGSPLAGKASIIVSREVLM